MPVATHYAEGVSSHLQHGRACPERTLQHGSERVGSSYHPPCTVNLTVPPQSAVVNRLGYSKDHSVLRFPIAACLEPLGGTRRVNEVSHVAICAGVCTPRAFSKSRASCSCSSLMLRASSCGKNSLLGSPMGCGCGTIRAVSAEQAVLMWRSDC